MKPSIRSETQTLSSFVKGHVSMPDSRVTYTEDDKLSCSFFPPSLANKYLVFNYFVTLKFIYQTKCLFVCLGFVRLSGMQHGSLAEDERK